MIDILLDYPSSRVRLVIRAYFTLVAPLLGFIGEKCCKKRVKLRLLKLQQTGVVHMAGWLKASQAASTMWSLRCSPSGWLGIVMVFAGLLWIASDLAVSALVVTVSIATRCSFNTAGLYSVISPSPFDSYVGEESSGQLFKLATQAQFTSQSNGGLKGIYEKINGDLSFRATEEDVVGQWNCYLTEDVTYPLDDTPASVIADLQSRGLLFTNSSNGCWQDFPDNTTGHVVALSASQPEQPTGLWDLRAAVELLGPTVDQKTMKAYSCSMSGPSVEWIVKQILVQTTLTGWCPELRGDLYSNTGRTAVLSDPIPILESLLHTLVMTSGAVSDLKDAPLIDPTQGCVASRTQVPLEVIILAAIAFITTLIMALYWIVLSLQIKLAAASQSMQYIKVVDSHTPDGVLGWMRHAVQEMAVAREVKNSDLKEWSFGVSFGGSNCNLKVMRKGTGVGMGVYDSGSENVRPRGGMSMYDSGSEIALPLGARSPYDSGSEIGLPPGARRRSTYDSRSEIGRPRTARSTFDSRSEIGRPLGSGRFL